MKQPYTRRAAFALIVVLSLWALAGHYSIADDEPDISGLVDDLVSGDAAKRKKAIAGITEVGLRAAPQLLRPGLRHAGKPGEDAIIDALAALGLEDCLGTLNGCQTVWPANRRGVQALLAKLRERRSPRLTSTVKLKEGKRPEPLRVPPFAEHTVTDVIPAALTGVDLSVQVSGENLEVDRDGDGKFDTTVDTKRPKRLLVGPKPQRAISLSRRLGRWYASSASLLVGRFAGESVELLDADLDGRFDGPNDLIAVGGEAFRRHAVGDLIGTAKGTARYRVVSTEGSTTLTISPEPDTPGVDSVLLRTVTALNAWRRGVGLQPVFVDVPRSRDCQAHVEYWRLNGYSGHDESPSAAGYTKGGARAGKHGSVSNDPKPERTVVHIAGTILHRETALGQSRYGLGVGYGVGSCLWGGTIGTRKREFPILVPAPGQENVPTTCRSENPRPSRDPGFYESPRGYAVAVWHYGLYRNLRNARIDLYRVDGEEQPLGGDLFSAEQPYRPEFSREPMTSFVADRALARATWYCARFTASDGDRSVDFTWTFRTK